MNTQRKKIGLLCVLLIAGGGWIGLASRHGGEHVGWGLPHRDPYQGKDPERVSASSLQPSSGLSASDPNLASATDAGLGSGELFLKMMLSVGLVVGLGVAALYLSKRVLPRVSHASGKEIHILETAYLGPRKALHLVEVGNHRLLIASASDNITMLTHIGDPWLDMAGQELGEAVKT